VVSDSSIQYGCWSLPHYRVCTHSVEIVSGTDIFSRGAGYIGSFTALALLEAGYKVVITDNLYNSSEEAINRIELICGKRPEFFSLDIRDEKAFDDVFSKHPDIDSVIHFAALKVRRVISNGEKPWNLFRPLQRMLILW
jgi:UDP-glucose 4-epimerase